MNWLEKAVRWDDSKDMAKITFPVPTVPYCTLREAIDAAILSNKAIESNDCSIGAGGITEDSESVRVRNNSRATHFI
jgi:hypothetical protein